MRWLTTSERYPNPIPLTVPTREALLQAGQLGSKQKELVAEGMEILIENGIDPIKGLENLVWAPNVTGQHTITALTNVVETLRKARSEGPEAVVKARERLGEQTANVGK